MSQYFVVTMPGVKRSKFYVARKGVKRLTIIAQTFNDDDADLLARELNSMKDRMPDKPLSETVILSERKPGQSWAQQSNQNNPRSAGKR